MLLRHIKELYDYRNLIWVLAWVEFKQRYKNSVLGYFWSLLEPLLMFAVLYIVFSNLMRVQVEYYQLFLLQGIIMWSFFTRSTTASLMAIAGKQPLVKKVYFPRDILVMAPDIEAYGPAVQAVFDSAVEVGAALLDRVHDFVAAP